MNTDIFDIVFPSQESDNNDRDAGIRDERFNIFEVDNQGGNADYGSITQHGGTAFISSSIRQGRRIFGL